MKIQNSSGKTIGIYDKENNVFRKKVSAAKHLFKKLNAWGIDGEVFNSLLLPKNTQIEVYDNDTQRLYAVDAKTYALNGKWLHFEGYGSQIFLPLDLFTDKSLTLKI